MSCRCNEGACAWASVEPRSPVDSKAEPATAPAPISMTLRLVNFFIEYCLPLILWSPVGAVPSSLRTGRTQFIANILSQARPRRRVLLLDSSLDEADKAEPAAHGLSCMSDFGNN